MKYRNNLDLCDKFVIGFVGRLEEQKNPLRLIDIFYEITKKDKSAISMIFRDGSMKRQIKKL